MLEQIKLFISFKGKPKRFTFDNEFGNEIKEYLRTQNIDFHSTKPNSHIGNSDVERFHGTITEKIRILNLENKVNIKNQIVEAIKFYNNTYHSTIKTTPQKAQNREVPIKQLVDNINKMKEKTLAKRNQNRENYTETRKEGYVKNYKVVRHKEQPKFRKLKLENIRTDNIKRPLKFSETEDDNDVDMVSINNKNQPTGNVST
jgi:hypothetical protein